MCSSYGGKGVTRQTYIWRTLCVVVRCKEEIVLPVASNDIASLLLPVQISIEWDYYNTYFLYATQLM